MTDTMNIDVVETEILFAALKKHIAEKILKSEIGHGTIIGSGNKWNCEINLLFKLAEKIGNYD
jgi:hypothetical protein